MLDKWNGYRGARAPKNKNYRLERHSFNSCNNMQIGIFLATGEEALKNIDYMYFTYMMVFVLFLTFFSRLLRFTILW
jgi:hypothetical protein